MTAKPKILVLKGQQETTRRIVGSLADSYEVVLVDSLWRGLALLRHGGYAGAYVESTDLAPLERAGVLLQADLVLDTMTEGVALLTPDGKILWANRQFTGWARTEEAPDRAVVGEPFYQALGAPQILGPDYCPLNSAAHSSKTCMSKLRTTDGRYLQVTATPVLDDHGKISHMVAIVHDITVEHLQQQKIATLHGLATKLEDLDPDDLDDLSIDERIDMLKTNIVHYAREVLDYAHIEIRLLDPATGRLDVLIAEGMTDEACGREMHARPDGNGIIGFVAAMGQSYLCEDARTDPLYLCGSTDARTSMTVPLVSQDRVIGVINVESPHAGAFDQGDLMFLEIFASNVSLALHTYELLLAEKATTSNQWAVRIRREAGVLVNDILSDAASVLDSSGHEAHVEERLQRIQKNARAVAEAFRRADERLGVGVRISAPAPEPEPPLRGHRVLVADADLQIRTSAYEFLSRAGCIVETAHNAAEAVAMAKTNPYHAALVDIRLPDRKGYEVYSDLKEHCPDMAVVLMTAFGYDPSHSIVKARAQGLRSVLFKPFRPEKLIREVEQAVGANGASAAESE